MSRTVPEYQRTQGFAPQAQSSGVQQAFSRAAQSMQTGTKETAVDQSSQYIVQSVANDYAQKAGIEAAKTPGQHFMAIGESGRHFVDAYKKEELQSVDFEGNQFLNNIYREASEVPNPGASTLTDFQENALAGIEEFSNSVGAENRPGMKRKLMDTYTDAFGRLSNKVQSANFKRLKAQNNMILAQKNAMMTDAFLEGNIDRGNALRDEIQAQLGGMEQMGLATPRQAALIADATQKESLIGTYNGKMLEAARNDRGEEYLRDLMEGDVLKGLTGAERKSVIRAAESTLVHYRAARAEKDFVVKDELLNKLESGELRESEAQEGLEELPEEGRQEVRSAITGMADKKFKQASAYEFIWNNAGNALELSQVKPQYISDVSQRLWQRAEEQRGEPLNLRQKAQSIVGLKAPNKVLTDQLSAAMSSLDPNLIADAANAIGILNEKNPLAIDSLSTRQQEQAIEINQAIKANMGVEGAIQTAIGRPEGVSPEEFEHNKMAVKETARMWSGVAASRQNTKTILNIPDSMVTPELEMALYNQVTATQLRIGDRRLASEIAKNNINKSWGPTNAMGGKAQYMRNAPEKFMDGGDQIARHQIINETHALIESLKEDNDSGFYYEFDVPKSEIDTLKKGITASLIDLVGDVFSNPEELKIRQVFTEPEHTVIEGKLVMRSDSETAEVGSGALPSYALYIETKDGLKALRDRNYQPKRYTLNPYAYQEEAKSKADAEINKQLERKKELQKIRMDNKPIESASYEAL